MIYLLSKYQKSPCGFSTKTSKMVDSNLQKELGPWYLHENSSTKLSNNSWLSPLVPLKIHPCSWTSAKIKDDSFIYQSECESWNTSMQFEESAKKNETSFFYPLPSPFLLILLKVKTSPLWYISKNPLAEKSIKLSFI